MERRDKGKEKKTKSRMVHLFNNKIQDYLLVFVFFFFPLSIVVVIHKCEVES